MVIKLLQNLPLSPSHGAEKGRTFEVLREEQTSYGKRLYFCKGADGKEFGVFPNECEVVEE